MQIIQNYVFSPFVSKIWQDRKEFQYQSLTTDMKFASEQEGGSEI